MAGYVTKDETAKVVRQSFYNLNEVNKFNIGDIISFVLNTGEEVQAMAMTRNEYDETLFVFMDSLKAPAKMHPVPDGLIETTLYIDTEYNTSLMKDILNLNVYPSFPEEIKERIAPFDEEQSEYLRLLTEKEVFGTNTKGKEEDSDTAQLEPMRNRINRMAFLGKDSDKQEWYWLQNKSLSSVLNFVAVSNKGDVTDAVMTAEIGIRPVFKMRGDITK